MLGGSLFACASTPAPQPVDVSKIKPGSSERVIDQVVILLDTSGSIDVSDQFPHERALLQSFVGAMPDGSYEVDAIAFGGVDREVYDANFDRGALASYAENVEYLSDGTPLHTVLGEVKSRLDGKQSNASVIVITDGLPSDVIGRDISPDLSLDAARELTAGYAGDLCIHTVQVGDDPAGAAFLGQLASASPCGTSRAASSLTDASSIQSFGRTALLTDLPAVATPPPTVVAAPVRSIDDDRDGVANSSDECPRTPQGATVDARGCWVIPELYFQLDSAEFEPTTQEALDRKVVPVLRQNPGVNVRIDGYTDSSGSAAYNLQLSERRAKAVRSYLISQGVDADRLETQGFGEANPLYPNDTAEGRKLNRRTEITPLN
jgi:OOP family OmpA-OmpF porin